MIINGLKYNNKFLIIFFHISGNKSVDSPIGYAANLRQNTKAQKYGDRLNQVGITCAPLVFEHYGGFTTFAESSIINKFASTWVQNHPEYSWDFCKKNVIDRLTLEHAKIIVEIFVHRTRLKEIGNTIVTGHSLYDGSSGFSSWTNREKTQKFMAALGPSSEDWKYQPNEWEEEEKKNGIVEWGQEPTEGMASWDS